MIFVLPKSIDLRIPKRPSPKRRHWVIKRHHLRQQWPELFAFLALAVKGYNQLIDPLHFLSRIRFVTHLNLSFFNSFQATLDEQPLVNFRSAKIQGILIFLALTAKQAQAREMLAALFWPDEPDGIAKKNLRQSLYRLRQLLGEGDVQGQPFLLTSYSTVQFNPASDYRLDVADFLAALAREDLETAVPLYHGELLPSFSCDSQPFADWLRQERERLQERALAALSTLTAQRLAQAAYPEAQALARKQLALEPWREEAHRQLMQVLALLGERSAALAQYERCQAILKDELGVEPATETKTLAATIARQQSTAVAPHLPATEPGQPRLAIPFVGRQTEFEQLVNSYRQTAVQGLQLVTLVGSAGIGKTRLAQEFLLWVATQGADVLRGRAYETSTDLPYQPIIQLFRQRLERENAPEDLLSDMWLAQLTRLWPELRERYPDLPEPLQAENIARQHLYEAVARLGQALASRTPLVMFIDDGQWADTASLDLLQHAVGRWAEDGPQNEGGPHSGGAPILLLVTLRQEALAESPETQRWLTHLKRHVPSRQLNLSELSEQETTHLLERLLVAQTSEVLETSEVSRFRDWLFTETAGQPLFLTETLKALVDEGVVAHASSTAARWQVDWARLREQTTTMRVWPGVREIVCGWLARLTDPASNLLTATAVLVEEASFNHLYRVAGLDESEAITALDELLARQILLEADSGFVSLHHDPIYQFSHQKISDVVYVEAGAARRRILHQRAFEALQASGTSAATLAHHALHAGLVAETIYNSLLAGDEARALFATQVAITHYKTAFQVGEQKGWPAAISGADRQALYTGLGRAYELSEQAEAAKELYEAMVAYARQVGAPAMECLGLNRLAELYSLVLFNPDKAFDVLGQAWLVAERTGDRRGMAAGHNRLAAQRQAGEELIEPVAFRFVECFQIVDDNQNAHVGQGTAHGVGPFIRRMLGQRLIPQFACQFSQQCHVVGQHKIFQLLHPLGRQFPYFGGEENFAVKVGSGGQVSAAHRQRRFADAARTVNQRAPGARLRRNSLGDAGQLFLAAKKEGLRRQGGGDTVVVLLLFCGLNYYTLFCKLRLYAPDRDFGALNLRLYGLSATWIIFVP